jgi:heterodisulfide reductase subunit B
MADAIGYFPGCSLEGTAKEYGQSLEAIAPLLGLKLQEIEDWNCCGATAAHNVNHKLSIALPARVLALAEKAGHQQVVAPCAACSHRLIVARHELAEDAQLRREIADIIELPYAGSVQVKNILQLLHEFGIDKLTVALKKKMTGLKVACYYGCLLVRPPKVMQFDDAENPQSMDKLMSALGAKPVEWGLKTDCCGGGFSMCRTDMVCKMTRELLDDATAAGAEAFVVACPMCQSNLDLRQHNVNQRYKTSFQMPVLYITQWIGLCLGLSAVQLGINRHYVDATRVIEKAFAAPPAPAKKAPAAPVAAGGKL